jgi:uncharacterized membrane protein YdbT with pleckstrin-like domain
MNYRSRPTWRDQWLLSVISLGFLLLALAVFVLEPQQLSSQEINTAIAVLAGLFALGLLTLLYRHFSWTFSIDDSTIESTNGIVARDVNSIRIEDVRNINVKQSIIQRILFIGDVEFSSAGGSGIEVAFCGVSRPMEVKNLLQSLQGAGPSSD